MSYKKSFGKTFADWLSPIDPRCDSELFLDKKTPMPNKSNLRKLAVAIAGKDSFDRHSNKPTLTDELSCLILLMPCFIINELNPAIKLANKILDSGARVSLRVNMEAEKSVYLINHRLQKMAADNLKKQKAKDMRTILQTPYSELVQITRELLQKDK